MVEHRVATVAHICHGKTYFFTFDEKDVDQFIEQANKFHPTIKFVAEISKNEITFLDTVVFKGERLKKESILDIKTH